MRFDDSLETVLAAEPKGAAGSAAQWRQLVDLIGRRRGTVSPAALSRLAAIREAVPLAVRVASAGGLERADPPVELVAFFAGDAPAVAAPVIRSARLRADDWIALLPSLSPVTRGLLRHRRDLDPRVAHALASYGAHDLALPSQADAAPPADTPVPAPAPPPATDEDFAIAALVSRIARHRARETERVATPPAPAGPAALAERFRYETDALGHVRWCDAVLREPLIGLSLAAPGADAAIAGAFPRRQRFADARLTVPGVSAVGGLWLLSGVPAFDDATGRFTGYRGTARRPRRDEVPAPAPERGDALRQLVHELRTPANAISGFAEMIEHQLLGPVEPAYRDYAIAIGRQAAGLLEAIEDLDMAARLDAHRLELAVEPVAMVPLLEGVMRDLAPLADLRGARLTLDVGRALSVRGDRHALERLFARLLTALLASARPGEQLAGDIASDGYILLCRVNLPAGFDPHEGALLDGAPEPAEDAEGTPLLGAAFAFRLARTLAGELDGGLTVTDRSLTLRLPAAVDAEVEQATS